MADDRVSLSGEVYILDDTEVLDKGCKEDTPLDRGEVVVFWGEGVAGLVGWNSSSNSSRLRVI